MQSRSSVRSSSNYPGAIQMGFTRVCSPSGTRRFLWRSSTTSVSIRTLHRALCIGVAFREETRPFNVIADDPNGVTCLVLDRQSYREMIADELSRLKRNETIRYARKKYVARCERDVNVTERRCACSTTFIGGEDERDLKNLRLADIEIISTLGVGGFGRVELVRRLFARLPISEPLFSAR